MSVVDELGTICTHVDISGFGLRDCVVLGHRFEYERPRTPQAMESWVIWSTLDAAGGSAIHYLFGHAGWLSGVWVTADRTLHVTDLEGALYVQPLASCSGTAWTPTMTFPERTYLHGIWGLGDDELFIWASDRQSAFVLRGSGTSWQRQPGPPFEIAVLRGSSPVHLIAGGTTGELARWDGSTWTVLPFEGGAAVTGIAVQDEDRFWVTIQSGSLFEGSAGGVIGRAETPGGAPLADVTVWHGDVWLAAEELGLMRLVPRTDQLEMVKPNIPVYRFDARQDLVMCCPAMIAATADGAVYHGGLVEAFAKAFEGIPPCW